MRYAGQGYEIRVAVPPGAPDAALLDDVRQSFEREYTAFYGQLCDGVPLEAVNWRVSVEGPRPDLRQVSERMAMREPASSAAAEPRRRDALFAGTGGFVPTPVYQRHLLAADFSAVGPAIIEEAESTTVVRPGWSVAVGTGGCLLLRAESAPGGAS